MITRSLIFSAMSVLFTGNPVAAQEILTLQQALETALDRTQNTIKVVLKP